VIDRLAFCLRCYDGNFVTSICEHTRGFRGNTRDAASNVRKPLVG
jgi:hypothetical protein